MIPFPTLRAGGRLAESVVQLTDPLTDIRAAERALRGARMGSTWFTTREPDTILLNSVARRDTGKSMPIQWHVVSNPASGKQGWLGLWVC